MHCRGKMIIGMQCKVCGDDHESVVHELWECPVHVHVHAYDSIRNTFVGEIENWGRG